LNVPTVGALALDPSCRPVLDSCVYLNRTRHVLAQSILGPTTLPRGRLPPWRKTGARQLIAGTRPSARRPNDDARRRPLCVSLSPTPPCQLPFVVVVRSARARPPTSTGVRCRRHFPHLSFPDSSGSSGSPGSPGSSGSLGFAAGSSGFVAGPPSTTGTPGDTGSAGAADLTVSASVTDGGLGAAGSPGAA